MKVYVLTGEQNVCHGHGDYRYETILHKRMFFETKEDAEYYVANSDYCHSTITAVDLWDGVLYKQKPVTNNPVSGVIKTVKVSDLFRPAIEKVFGELNETRI
jgi:hypothetical protein